MLIKANSAAITKNADLFPTIFIYLPPIVENNAVFWAMLVPINILSRVLVTAMAVNMWTAIPINKVKANPVTRLLLAAVVLPKMYITTQAISVVTLQSRI